MTQDMIERAWEIEAHMDSNLHLNGTEKEGK